MKLRDVIKSGLPFLVLLGVVAVLVVAQKRANAPREFRGTLLCDVVHIGGEGGAAVLVAADGAYDLFVPRVWRGRWKWDLEPFNNKRVVVIGRPFTAKGIERKRYRAIHVIDVKPE